MLLSMPSNSERVVPNCTPGRTVISDGLSEAHGTFKAPHPRDGTGINRAAEPVGELLADIGLADRLPF